MLKSNYKLQQTIINQLIMSFKNVNKIA